MFRDLWRYASDVPVRGAALRQPRGWGAVRRFRREPQERPREPQVEHRGPHIRSILSTRSLRHNYPPRQPVRGQATAQPKIKPSTRPVDPNPSSTVERRHSPDRKRSENPLQAHPLRHAHVRPQGDRPLPQRQAIAPRRHPVPRNPPRPRPPRQPDRRRDTRRPIPRHPDRILQPHRTDQRQTPRHRPRIGQAPNLRPCGRHGPATVVRREGGTMADRQHPQSRHHRRPPRDQTMDTRTIQQMVREARRAQILSQHRPHHPEGDAHARRRRPDPIAPRVPPHRPVPRRQRAQHRQLPEPMARQLLPEPRLPLDRIAGHDHRTHQPAHRRDHHPQAHHATNCGTWTTCCSSAPPNEI